MEYAQAVTSRNKMTKKHSLKTEIKKNHQYLKYPPRHIPSNNGNFLNICRLGFIPFFLLLLQSTKVPSQFFPLEIKMKSEKKFVFLFGFQERIKYQYPGVFESWIPFCKSGSSLGGLRSGCFSRK